jgi:hypothetical protein
VRRRIRGAGLGAAAGGGVAVGRGHGVVGSERTGARHPAGCASESGVHGLAGAGAWSRETPVTA